MRKLLVNNVSIFIYALLSTFFISFTITDNFISLVMSVSGAALIQTGMLALFFIRKFCRSVLLREIYGLRYWQSL